MRLLNTQSLELRFFQDGDTPSYAALSHVHDDDEVVYETFEHPVFLSDSWSMKERWEILAMKKGYEKVRKSCEIALLSGIEWIWIGTCCIDWSSRMEMNEAINLTYQRLKRAKVCYAYLGKTDVGTHGMIRRGYQSTADDAFLSCPWFQRSWTLQELLAPPEIRFFNANWEELGTKASLASKVFHVTGISPAYLTGQVSPRSAPYAERISWACDRKSLLIEDHVYAILGLFKIRIEINYGEGAEAFLRFRREVLKECDGTALFGRKALQWSQNKLLQQLGHTDFETGHFEDFYRHSMLWVSQSSISSWDDIRHFCIEMAKSPPVLTESGYKLTTICRQVRDFLVVWTFSTQKVANLLYAVCTKVTPLSVFPGSAHLSIRGRAEDQVYHVRRERLRGFQLCDIFLPIETRSATFQLFDTS
jgi:hypothetical protein